MGWKCFLAVFYGGGGALVFFPFKKELIQDIKLYNGTVLRISGSWEKTHGLLCLHHSFLGTQKFRDKGSFPTKG